MDSAAEAELQRRRERARISQRAFRIRQAAELSALREENARLKAAIGHVADAVQTHDRPALRTVIRNAAEAAGLKSGSPADRDTSESIIIPPTESAAPTSTTPPGDMFQTAFSLCAPVPEICCSTFRLDSGLLSLPSGDDHGIINPPADVALYLGANRHTLAGQLYWYCTEASLALLYRLGGREPSRARVIASGHPFFVGMLRYVATLCSTSYIIALAEARVQFFRLGYCSAENPAAAEYSSTMVRERIETVHRLGEEEAAAAGVEGEWWGPRDVEHVAYSSLTAGKTREKFIHQLWLGATCFGDEPRWRASRVMTLVEGLVREENFC
ncbi:hypothetical protein QBC47DRAFT_361585 [Echria macrotheca]|uniref:BZIP domain-containing protein n=1 Tax=Echria macrotheca TaxID=438768 RepID=A0AAJ0FAR3_9PEZI|nr:hypothetical protein QBC47DRAFT_361585 [Echria macrotheca]